MRCGGGERGLGTAACPTRPVFSAAVSAGYRAHRRGRPSRAERVRWRGLPCPPPTPRIGGGHGGATAVATLSPAPPLRPWIAVIGHSPKRGSDQRTWQPAPAPPAARSAGWPLLSRQWACLPWQVACSRGKRYVLVKIIKIKNTRPKRTQSAFSRSSTCSAVGRCAGSVCRHSSISWDRPAGQASEGGGGATSPRRGTRFVTSSHNTCGVWHEGSRAWRVGAPAVRGLPALAAAPGVLRRTAAGASGSSWQAAAPQHTLSSPQCNCQAGPSLTTPME